MKFTLSFLNKNQEERSENCPKFAATAMLKRPLSRTLRIRFHNLEDDDPDRRAPKWPFFCIATFLDPRYSMKMFSVYNHFYRPTTVLLKI